MGIEPKISTQEPTHYLKPQELAGQSDWCTFVIFGCPETNVNKLVWLFLQRTIYYVQLVVTKFLILGSINPTENVAFQIIVIYNTSISAGRVNIKKSDMGGSFPCFVKSRSRSTLSHVVNSINKLINSSSKSSISNSTKGANYRLGLGVDTWKWKNAKQENTIWGKILATNNITVIAYF